MDKITFYPEDGKQEAVDFYVLEETMIGGVKYILVTDVEDGDGEALILKDLSQDGDGEALYAIVEDDGELTAVADVFRSMMGDIDLE